MKLLKNENKETVLESGRKFYNSLTFDVVPAAFLVLTNDYCLKPYNLNQKGCIFAPQI
jgi:hypothetical protein